MFVNDELDLLKIAGFLGKALGIGAAGLGIKTIGDFMSSPPRPTGPFYDRSYEPGSYTLEKKRGYSDFDPKTNTVYHNPDRWDPMRVWYNTWRPEEIESMKELGYLRHNHSWSGPGAEKLRESYEKNHGADPVWRKYKPSFANKVIGLATGDKDLLVGPNDKLPEYETRKFKPRDWGQHIKDIATSVKQQ